MTTPGGRCTCPPMHHSLPAAGLGHFKHVSHLRLARAAVARSHTHTDPRIHVSDVHADSRTWRHATHAKTCVRHPHTRVRCAKHTPTTDTHVRETRRHTRITGDMQTHVTNGHTNTHARHKWTHKHMRARTHTDGWADTHTPTLMTDTRACCTDTRVCCTRPSLQLLPAVPKPLPALVS